MALLQTAAFAVDLTLPPAIQDGFRIGGVFAGRIGFDGGGDLYLAGSITGKPFSGATVLGPGGGDQDLFVAKVSPSGQQLLYFTQIGGSSIDSLGGMVVDHDGNVFLAGSTRSADFPVTASAYRSTITKGGAFVLKLDSSGKKLVFATFLDDSYQTGVNALAIDHDGSIYAGGMTDGNTFPTTAGAYMRSVLLAEPLLRHVGFVSKLSADGKVLLFSTLFGGTDGQDSVSAIAIDASGSIHLAGRPPRPSFPSLLGQLLRFTTPQCT